MSAIKSIQQVTLGAASGTTTDVTISAVNTSKAFCAIMGIPSSASGGGGYQGAVRTELLNSTTVRFTGGYSFLNFNQRVRIVEFN